MTQSSKNIQNILFILATLIILYGAYNALFITKEGIKNEHITQKKKICRRGKKTSKKCAFFKCKRRNKKKNKLQNVIVKKRRKYNASKKRWNHHFKCIRVCTGNKSLRKYKNSKFRYKCAV